MATSIYWTLNEAKAASEAWRRIYKQDISFETDSLVDSDKCPLYFTLDANRRRLLLEQKLPNGKIVNPSIKLSECELLAMILYGKTQYMTVDNRSITLSDLFRIRLSVNKKAGLIILRLFINTEELDNLLRFNQSIVAPAPLDKLISDLGNEITNRPDSSSVKLISDIIKTAVVPRLDSGLGWIQCVRKAKTPFPYQQANVDWMASLEKGADMGFNRIDYVDYIGLTQCNLRKIGLPPLAEDPNPYKVYRTKDGFLLNDEVLWSNSSFANLRGGVLCDEVGLGKTLSMVGLILKNPVLPTRFSKALKANIHSQTNVTVATENNAKTIPTDAAHLPRKILKPIRPLGVDQHAKVATGNLLVPVVPVVPVAPVVPVVPVAPVVPVVSNMLTDAPKKVQIKLKMPVVVEKSGLEPSQVLTPESPDSDLQPTVDVIKEELSAEPESVSIQECEKPKQDKEKEKEKEKEKDKYGGLYKSVATLVLVPARLCQQWEDEINSYVEPCHKIDIIKITTIVQLRNYTYKDLQNADVVIVSYPFLTNRNYQTQEDLNLHKVFWHRVILDEGHEVLFPTCKKVMERTIAQAIYSFRSTYRWCVTGDPLAHTRTGFEGILMFLANIEYGQTKNGLLQTMESKTINHILDRYFRRNTKASTKAQIIIPGIKEVVKYLTFSKTEKAIYDNVPSDDHKRRLQLCTNILISDKDSDIIGGKVVSMENINNSMKEHYVKLSLEIEESIADTIRVYDEWKQAFPGMLKEITDKIKKVEALMLSGIKLTDEEITAYEDLKDQKTKLHNRDRYREKSTKEKMLKLCDELRDTQNQIKIFTELNAANFRDKPCQVCGEKIVKENPLCLYPCGHMNCAGCIELIFNSKTNSNCPFCRKSVTRNAIQSINSEKEEKLVGQDKDKEKQKQEEVANKDPILDRWGTKMSYLIQYLKDVLKNEETRVILFSQWNQMLEMVSMVLAESRIQHVFCKGNVHMITKSISKFKTDPSIRVIMLSSESCSSGNNLTEATNIILLDTPNTDKEAALAIENQAIGRLVRLGQARTVEVVRMIMKDTVEEEYYRRNHCDS
jgi:SNF2 family DNA or RNA helicase